MAEGGTKRLRGRSWQFRAYVDGRYITTTVPPEDGRAVGEKRADQMLRRWVTREEAKVRAAPSGTVDELWRKWWRQASPNWAPGTFDAWESYWRLHGQPALGHLRVVDVTTEVVDELYVAMRDGTGPRKSKLKPASVRKLHEPLRLCFAQAVRWGYIDKSPINDASPPTRQRKAIKVPAADVVTGLIALAEKTNPDFMTFVHLSADTGGRRSMIVGLRWDSVELWQEEDPGTSERRWQGDVVFQASAVVKRGEIIGEHGDGRPKRARSIIVIRDTTKTDTEWRVSLHASTAARLHEHKLRILERCADIGIAWHPGMFVFTQDPTGALPWLPTAPTTAFMRLRKRAGATGVRLHDLRHFMASKYMQAGVDEITVMGRGGWSDLASFKRYAHFSPANDRAASKRVGDDIFGTAPAPTTEQGAITPT